MKPQELAKIIVDKKSKDEIISMVATELTAIHSEMVKTEPENVERCFGTCTVRVDRLSAIMNELKARSDGKRANIVV